MNSGSDNRLPGICADCPNRIWLSCSGVLHPWPTIPALRGCEKLSNQAWYRVRQGVYRIVYEIQDQALLVTVVKIGHRREVYRKR